MALVLLTKEDARVMLVEQATWGTAGLDNAAGIILDIETIAIDFDDKAIETNPALATRVEDDRGFFTHQNRAMPKCEITGIVHNDHIARFMYGYYQSVVEGATTPFEKTFVVHSSQPDFTNDEGYFFTLIVDQSIAGRAHKIADCIVAELKFDVQPGEPMKFTASIVARGAADDTSTPSGSYTRAVQSFYFGEQQRVHTINYGGGALTPVNLAGYQIEFKQEVAPIGMGAAGRFDSFRISKKSGVYKNKAVFEAETWTAFINRASNTPLEIVVGWGNASAGTDDLDLEFTLNGKVKPETIQNVDDDLGVDLDFKLTGDIANSQELCTAIVADDIDMTW